MLSLSHFIGLPIVNSLGLALAPKISIYYFFANIKPVDCGPPMAFPPLNSTKSKTILTNFNKLDLGGNWAAASQITGIPCLCEISTHYLKSESLSVK